MDDTGSQTQHPPHRRSGSRDEGSPGGRETKKPGSKGHGHKRTKTGCLTCRKRRIKCGEERPTCENCRKSKRKCEGYNQRVVFKEPINVYRGPQSSSTQASGSMHTFKVRRGEPVQTPLQAPGPLSVVPGPSSSTTVTSKPELSLINPEASTDEHTVHEFNAEETYSTSHGRPPLRSISPPSNNPDASDHSKPGMMRTEKLPLEEEVHPDQSAFQDARQGSTKLMHTAPESMDLSGWSDGPTTTTTPRELYPPSSNWPDAAGPSTSFTAPLASTGAYGTPFSTDRMTPKDRPASQQPYQYEQSWDRQQVAGQQVAGYRKVDRNFPEGLERIPVPLDVDMDSDDPYDVSDGDYETDDGRIVVRQGIPADSCTMDDELGAIVTFQADQINQDLSLLRSITSYIDRPNMLSTYVPSHRSSPLNNIMTARIFYHFINVTAATISLYERHPANPSLILQGTPVPKSQQHIWTYTIPSLALRNDGLLHAVLAIAALHIAKLQNDHITASLKHYSISLRRIGKSVSNSSRRSAPATLAASLVLAFYECWCADHQKWSNHILGAQMLLREVDFAGMTRCIKSLKLKQRQEEEAQNFPGMQQTFGGIHEDGLYQRANEDVDENIVGMLMGKKVRYDQYGQILDDDAADNTGRKSYSRKQLQDYEIQQDLFWWYCKMDAYHSILGGGRLFMEYDRWSHCPPRAPLGRLSAPYGTYDHLMLLIGRIANFAARDLKRKRLAWKANAERRPHDGTSVPNQADQANAPQPPPFSGMVPDTGEPKLPMGFQGSFESQTPLQPENNLLDLEAQRIEAEEEWHDIMNAFTILEDHFGEDFQPLGPEFSRPIESPFGTALQYRTYAIAGIWMNYYIALIVCHRAHPSMPPAAMMAVGMAARQTAFFANEVGRIAAGIGPYCSSASQVTPGVGAGLIESSFCLFIAGVQYQDHAHRTWTISRLMDIARLTGWQSSNSVIAGCEGSWIKLAERGRGPPYVRTAERKTTPNMSDEELRRTRRIDNAIREKGGKVKVQETDRAHYAIGLLGFEDDFERMELENEGVGT